MRRRSWVGLSIGITISLFSYVPYAAAFIPPERIHTGLVAVALVVAPLVFLAVGLISHHARTLNRVLVSMGWLLVLGLTLGLVAPVLGAAAGFGVGIALTLRQTENEGQLRRRLVAVAFALVYVFVMLLLIPPAGVLAGAVLPGLMVGLADEYGARRSSRSRTSH